jgi:signal transduction histidine kinase
MIPGLTLPEWLSASNAAIGGAAAGLLGGLWVLRNRELARFRAEEQAVQSLAGEMLLARSLPELHERMLRVLQGLFDVGAITIYAHNPAGNSLHAVAPAGLEASVASLDAERPADGLRLAFRQRAPIFLEDPRAFPCPVLWLPMTAEEEPTGVLECRFTGFGKRPDQNAKRSLQHVANQAAFAFLLLEQRQMREDILRGERLGAALELISGIASEVRIPLDRIQNHAEEIRQQPADDRARSLSQQVGNDAAYARTLLDRLVSFSRTAPTQPAAFDWNSLLRSLIAFRSDPWRLLILEPEVELCPQQLPVFGVRGQLEQAMLGLLVHAEQSLRKSGGRRIRIVTSVDVSHALLRLEYAADLESAAGGGLDPAHSAMSLAVIRGILEGHGGAMRIENAEGRACIEARLPLSGPALPPPAPADAPASPLRSLTLLVCVPGEEDRRRLVELSAKAGHRAIPAGSAAEALELMERLRFDAVVASSALSDMIWTDLLDRVHTLHTGFILLDAAQQSVPPDLPVLRPPFELSELSLQLNRLLV